MNPPSNYSALNILTPVGNLYLQAGPAGLRRCAFASSREVSEGADLRSAQPETPLLREAAEQLREYFRGERKAFSIPLDLAGLPFFQVKVLLAAAQIPWGETRAYAQLARSIGSAGASRAVGSALARNPLLLFIPCHRVIGSDGALRGFAAPHGIRAKAWLLRHEGLCVHDCKIYPRSFSGANS